jgi:protein-disulfide isomerase
MSMTSPKLILGVVVAAALAIGGWWFTRPAMIAPETATAQPAPEASQSGDIALLPDVVLGAPDAPITLIEYGSYTCSHCANFHKTVFVPLKADYIDTGKVRFIHREVYFDRFGLLAAMVANCGGDERYYALSGAIYDAQADWIGDGAEATISTNLRKLGLRVGLSQDALDACMTDNDRAQRMVATFQANASADNVSATPTLFINGEKYANMSYSALKAIIDAKLAN